MTVPDADGLPPPHRLAVAYSTGPARPAMQALMSFDGLLARSVAGASEPLLGQMKLAWWREELAKPSSDRARGNPHLDALQTWEGAESSLIELVDGWEHLLGEAPLPEANIEAFAEGRGAALGALARLTGTPSAADAARQAGRRWALADLAFRVSDPDEKERCRKLYERLPTRREALPAVLRGVAVLDGLSRRAMARDEPLMTGRGGAFAAMRLGMLGR